MFGDVLVEREFAEHRRRAVNPMPAFFLLAERFRAVELQQFDSEGVTGSGGWKPLKQATIDEKLRNGYDLRILHRTLRLRESLTHDDHPDHIRRITPTFMEVGSSATNDKGLSYPTFHQQGRGVPVRKPIDFTEIERRRWVKTLQRYIVTGELILAGTRGTA